MTLMRVFRSFVTVFLIALPVGVAAQDQPERTRNGFDPIRLARVDSALQRFVDEARVAGAVGLVLRDGEVVYERAVGWADREARQSMQGLVAASRVVRVCSPPAATMLAFSR